MRETMKRLLFALALCLLAGEANVAPRYAIPDLGTLPGYKDSRATCLNDKGQVAGYGKYQGQTRAFLLTPQ